MQNGTVLTYQKSTDHIEEQINLIILNVWTEKKYTKGKKEIEEF